MEKSDIIYYVAWILTFILLGVWVLVWAMDYVSFLEMVMVWLLSVSILLIIFGTMRSEDAPRGSTVLIGAGLLLAIFMIVLLGVTTDLIGGLMGMGFGIILVGIAGLVLLFLSIRQRQGV
jgi:hypothetical protein